jgi:hypothetical protein
MRGLTDYVEDEYDPKDDDDPHGDVDLGGVCEYYSYEMKDTSRGVDERY